MRTADGKYSTTLRSGGHLFADVENFFETAEVRATTVEGMRMSCAMSL